MAGINFSLKTAYNYFGNQSQNKMFHMARPLLKSTETTALTCNVDCDFAQTVNTGTINITAGSADALWDVATFDISSWSGSSIYFNDWISVNGMGYCAAFEFSGSTSTANIDFYNWAIAFEPGGII
jgi:hypothetical protein